MRVAIYVQHLLGSGHLVRMQEFGCALHEAGHDVCLVSGGRVRASLPYEVIQLPVLKTNPGDFLTLLDEDGDPVDTQWKEARRDSLLQHFSERSFDAVVIETWPFGRRQLEFEIVPMLELLIQRPCPPLIVSSIRDVLQQRKAKRRRQTLDNLQRYFSLVMVHGDPGVLALEASFAEAAQIPCDVRYTGYFTGAGGDLETAATDLPRGEVLVSAGGGAAGLTLLETAVAAAAMDQQSEQCWRLLVGHNLDDDAFLRLRSSATENVVVERNRKDFLQLLKRCKISVSQFGYNTALDLVAAECAAVVVPFEQDGETEQWTRAARFAEKGRLHVLSEQNMNAESLLVALDQASAVTPAKIELDLDGAVNSVAILHQHIEHN